MVKCPFLQPLYLLLVSLVRRVLGFFLLGAFGRFWVGRSRSLRISLPRTSCMGELSVGPHDIAAAFPCIRCCLYRVGLDFSVLSTFCRALAAARFMGLPAACSSCLFMLEPFPDWFGFGLDFYVLFA